MPEKRINPKLLQVYDRLVNYFFSGEMALTILNVIRQEYKGKITSENDLFILASITSTFNTAILVMANTVNTAKPNNDSIHLTYLINQIKVSRNTFEPDTYESLILFVHKFEEELAKIAPTIIRVVELRDKTVAHIDRKYVNDPASILQNPPIEWDDMIFAYDLVGSGLLEIGKYLGFDENIGNHIVLSNFLLKNKATEIYRSLIG